MYGACKRRQATPLALWHMLRTLDESGKGWIERDLAREYSLTIWSRDKFYRALREAKKLGIVHDGWWGNRKVIRMASLLRTAQSMKVTHLGYRAVFIDLEDLRTAATFKRAMFSAFHTGRSRKPRSPISRKTITDITGLPRRTQRRYEKESGVITAQRNWKLTGLAPEGLEWARDNWHGACRVIAGQVVIPKPNSYVSSLARSGRRTVREVNKHLRDGLSTKSDGRHLRMYFEDGAQAERAGRKDRGIQGVPTGLQSKHKGRFVKVDETIGRHGLWIEA